jgi:hypothetical protein
VRVEIEHRGSKGFGSDVGFYFGFQQFLDGDSHQQSFVTAAFNDRWHQPATEDAAEEWGTRIATTIRWFGSPGLAVPREQPEPTSIRCIPLAAHLFPQGGKPIDASPRPWREMILEFTDAGVSTYWEGTPIGTVDRTKLYESLSRLKNREGHEVSKRSAPGFQGSFGLYVNAAGASFRSLRIEDQ